MPDLTPFARLRALLLGLLCLGADTAFASEVLISARVEDQKLVNTTPRSRWCSIYNLCSGHHTIDVPFEMSKQINLASPDDRDKAYVHLPPRQSFTLTNRSTQETARMQLGYRFVSMKYTYQTQNVIGRSVRNCRFESVSGSPNASKFLWSVYNSDAPAACVSVAGSSDELQLSVFNELMLTYLADFPSAASLSPGIWEGYIDYPIGSSNGFDFGNVLQLSSNNIRFRVEITVKHDMQVEFPASGSAVEVIPPGGWKQYETTNKIPPKLVHDSPLKIWAASPFAVYVTCQYGSNLSHCAMKHLRVPDLSAIYTTLTLPATFHHNGQPVTSLPLGVGAANAKMIRPVGNVSSQPGLVHFEVPQSDIRRMMVHFRGATYSGNVTLMFDANF